MTLQEQLNLLRAAEAPMPLIGMEENLQAMRLREAGLTYGSIAAVMRVYHGSTRGEISWRYKLRACGASPKHYTGGALRVPPRNGEKVS